ncbi:hypothetical protein HDV00_000745 [Rhizophlyctis rosea]|nr:hypothetical protein HDV00_000745 [Rhizophlyctis rosea]
MEALKEENPNLASLIEEHGPIALAQSFSPAPRTPRILLLPSVEMDEKGVDLRLQKWKRGLNGYKFVIRVEPKNATSDKDDIDALKDRNEEAGQLESLISFWEQEGGFEGLFGLGSDNKTGPTFIGLRPGTDFNLQTSTKIRITSLVFISAVPTDAEKRCMELFEDPTVLPSINQYLPTGKEVVYEAVGVISRAFLVEGNDESEE